MSFDERKTAAGAQGVAHIAGRACPFCGTPAIAQFCGACGRDTTGPRRPCGKCGRMVPSKERSCWNCGTVFKSDMRWKIPLIVLLFLLAFAISIVIALLK
jgi:predicted amidophosphoribosyltransferase